MTTASPVRIVETKGSRNWPSTKEATSSSNNMAAHELGLLLKEHRFLGNMKDVGPNRSGSAPPSMEGSFAAIGNLIGLQNCSLEGGFEGGLACISNAIKTCESEEQLRADPAYLEYYLSNVNLNPRLPPPLISRENRHLAHHVGRFGDARRKISFDDTNNSSSFLSRATLSTHKEEPEDDRSSTQASSTLAGRSTSYLSDQFTSSLEGRHKSLVDLIQEDFPRTPSPVYNNQSRSSNHGLTEEATDSDALVDPLHDSIGTAKLAELTTVTMGIHVHSVGSVPNNDISANPLSSSLSSNRTETPNSGPKVESSSDGAHLDIENGALVSGMAGSHLTSIELEMKNLSVSSEQINQHALKHPQQNTLHRGGTASQVQGSLSQTMSLGERHSHNSAEHLNHGQSKVPFVEMQTVLQSTGLTPPLYATATAYMTSGNQFYPNLQPSSLFAPQYGVGGYTLNTTLMPPYIAGYPSHGTTIPMAFDNTTNPNYNASTTGVTTGGSITPGVDMQNLYKFYGQLGIPTQPSFTDPFYMHYFQHPSLDPYGSVGQYNSITSRGSIIGSQPDGYDLQKGPAAYIPDQRPRYLRSGETSIPSPRKGGNTASPNYYGSPPSLGLLMQYPTSPVGSTVLPGSTITGTSLPGRRNDNIRSSANSSRNVGAYSGWQGQRGREKVDDLRPCSFLEELKSSKARRFELSDIAGRIVEFSADQHGSRFIQQKLENCTCEEKASVFKEVLPHASALMTDVFGNYVIQKFFEHGNTEQRKELASQLVGHILPLSLQMYGCRVIQKALEVIELDQKTQLVLELDGHILRCVRDQNGNHVIQKCIECVPAERIGFIISAFSGQVATLSTHPYGCRVIQRVLEYCTDEMQSQSIVDEILQSACVLTQDQYGNYVTQHVLERGKPHERSQIISKLAGQIVQMSQHKFASNVIEKCLEHGDAAEREILIGEIVGQTEGNDNLLIMMKDQFANYVVQKILETCSDVQREILLSRIRVHLQALKKYTYGKHIVACIEELSGEETHASES